MDPKKIQRIYLHAMYSGLPETIESDEERFVIAHCSEARAQVERVARVRNMRTVLHGDMRLLSRVLDKPKLLPYVQNYVASKYFWMHRGRTLIEDFCLFLVECSSAPMTIKVLARIEGVYTGLSATIDADTPWAAHSKWHEGGDTFESFRSPFALSFPKMFSAQPDYEPEPRDVNCVICRSRHNIHVKFHGI